MWGVIWGYVQKKKQKNYILHHCSSLKHRTICLFVILIFLHSRDKMQPIRPIDHSIHPVSNRKIVFNFQFQVFEVNRWYNTSVVNGNVRKQKSEIVIKPTIAVFCNNNNNDDNNDALTHYYSLTDWLRTNEIELKQIEWSRAELSQKCTTTTTTTTRRRRPTRQLMKNNSWTLPALEILVVLDEINKPASQHSKQGGYPTSAQPTTISATPPPAAAAAEQPNS